MKATLNLMAGDIAFIVLSSPTGINVLAEIPASKVPEGTKTYERFDFKWDKDCRRSSGVSLETMKGAR
jgi:hypothetical protein